MPGRVAGHLGVGVDDAVILRRGLRVSLLNFGSSARPKPAAASAHCVLRCLVGSTTVIRSVVASARSSDTTRRAIAVLPDPGVATVRKPCGLAADTAPMPDAASPAKPGCRALHKPAPKAPH